MSLVKLNSLYYSDAIYFPIVVNKRHGIARYPVVLDANGMITKDHELLEFYYLNGVNKELDVFDIIIEKLDKGGWGDTGIHPDISSVISVTLIDSKKLSKKKIVAVSWLSFRANAGELVAYTSLPLCMNVATNTIERIIPNEQFVCLTDDTFTSRFKFITAQIVNSYS